MGSFGLNHQHRSHRMHRDIAKLCLFTPQVPLHISLSPKYLSLSLPRPNTHNAQLSTPTHWIWIIKSFKWIPHFSGYSLQKSTDPHVRSGNKTQTAVPVYWSLCQHSQRQLEQYLFLDQCLCSFSPLSLASCWLFTLFRTRVQQKHMQSLNKLQHIPYNAVSTKSRL